MQFYPPQQNQETSFFESEPNPVSRSKVQVVTSKDLADRMMASFSGVNNLLA